MTRQDGEWGGGKKGGMELRKGNNCRETRRDSTTMRKSLKKRGDH